MERRFNLIDEPWLPIVDVGRVSLRQVFSEFGKIEVAVRIDPHGRDDACCDGADTGAPVVLP